MESNTADRVQELLTQRNQAIACAILSITLSLALIMNTFLRHRTELVEANKQVLELQRIVTALQIEVRANQQALVDTQNALKRAQGIH